MKFPTDQEIRKTIPTINKWVSEWRHTPYDRLSFQGALKQLAEEIGSSSDMAPKMGMRFSVQLFIKTALKIGIAIGIKVAEDRRTEELEAMRTTGVTQ